MLSEAAGMPGTDGRNNSGMHGRLQRNIHQCRGMFVSFVLINPMGSNSFFN
jgi:hypothetical protein